MPLFTVPYKFEPRDYQVPLLHAMDIGFKRACVVWHRRSGKDKTLFAGLVVRKAFERRGTYFYFFPTFKQGRRILWDGMDRDGFPFLGHIPPRTIVAKNATDMRLQLINGSIIQVVGTDNIDSIVGTNPIGCVYSEFSLQDPRGWDFIRPILRENGGWAVFNFTPRGKNHAFLHWERAKRNPEWYTQLLTVDDTKVLTLEDIEKERAEGMHEDLVQQEYYCSFEGSQEGAYFSSQLRKMNEEERITQVPFEPSVAVDTWWDLGMDDATAIVFTQNCGRELHIIDYFEDSGEGLPYYASILAEKAQENGYHYGIHTLPHDAQVRELGTGRSRLITAMGLLGRDKVRCSPKPKTKADAIEGARSMLGISWVDVEKCAHFIDCLHSYRKEYDEKRKVFKNEPVHDWASHAADALQTCGMAHSFTYRLRAGRRDVSVRGSAGWT